MTPNQTPARIIWHPAKVAATWPPGSVVLVDDMETEFPLWVCYKFSNYHPLSWPLNARFALLRSGKRKAKR